MATERLKTKSTSRKGVNYVRSIVEGENSIFQEIDQFNDQGNDAYIELINNEEATGCCIAVQIKSGTSFVSNTDGNYIFKADKRHFKYWGNHILPISGIVYNPANDVAVWCDITDHLRCNPTLMNEGPYNIKICRKKVFSKRTFSEIRNYFLKKYSGNSQRNNDASFGKSLEWFVKKDDPSLVLAGMKSLFFNHRNRTATWDFIVTFFPKINDEYLRRILCVILAHIPGHGDIGYTSTNIIEGEVRAYGLELIRKNFGREEVILLLDLVDDELFSRGSIGQNVHAIVDIVRKRDEILESIAYEKTVSDRIRLNALLLLVYYHQIVSSDEALTDVQEYSKLFYSSQNSTVLNEMTHSLKEYGCISFY